MRKFFSVLLTCLLCASQVYAYEPKPVELKLLRKVQKDTFVYFLQMTDRNSGLTRDNSRPGSPSSTAATGFALAAFAIAAEHGWITRENAEKRILTSLRTLYKKAEHKNGFFYHFLNMRTGERTWKSEASSIDTALLIAGAFVAAAHFPGTEIAELTQKIYERIDWKWMLNDSDLICMGWTPEAKFLPYYWDSYNELLILQALALGSPTHPVPPSVWQAWFRNEDEYEGHNVVFSHSASLFTYQYSHAFIDFRNLDDRGINYWDNSVEATHANRKYSMSFKEDYKSYNAASWGLSASVGPGGYKAYGAKPGEGLHDGTITPNAAIGSIIFTPKESINATKFFYKYLRDKIYGKYGFSGAYNIDKKFYAKEWLGIDQGIIFMMLENYLNDYSVYKKFMPLPAIQKFIKVAELKK